MTRRIAIYGGSFDPFHLGHLVPTVRAQETFHFEAVYFRSGRIAAAQGCGAADHRHAPSRHGRNGDPAI